MEMLELNNLHKTFNPGTVNEKVALNGVSLHMEAGDFATIVGHRMEAACREFCLQTGTIMVWRFRLMRQRQKLTGMSDWRRLENMPEQVSFFL